MDAANSGSGIDRELEEVIKGGVASGRFSSTSRVALLEGTADRIINDLDLDDVKLFEKLREIDSGSTAVPTRIRTFLIPFEVPYTKDVNKRRPEVLAITPSAFLKCCTCFGVPVLFVENLLESQFWIKPGNGMFLAQDENGKSQKLEIFYRYSHGWSTGRSYIFTTYNFVSRLTTNIFVNFNPKTKPLVEKLMKSASDDPLALHVLLASHTLDAWNYEGGVLRSILQRDEWMSKEGREMSVDPKSNTQTLHRLSKDFHILLEDLNDLEATLLFLQELHRTIASTTKSQASLTNRANKISYLLSGCRNSRRWISNYNDRTNIRINLAFHLSTQLDNDINLQISKATTALAKESHRDSSSMITIAAVTMFFLPGTFISAIFSMTFFNFQQDSTGNQEFQVSDRWWYFLAATIPLTLLVFVVWIVWQRLRWRRFKDEDALGVGVGVGSQVGGSSGTNLREEGFYEGNDVAPIETVQREYEVARRRWRGRINRLLGKGGLGNVPS